MLHEQKNTLDYRGLHVIGGLVTDLTSSFLFLFWLQLNTSFAVLDKEAGVERTEVLLRNEDNVVLGRQDTKGHVTAAFPNVALHHGAKFFVVLRATNRAGVLTEAVSGC